MPRHVRLPPCWAMSEPLYLSTPAHTPSSPLPEHNPSHNTPARPPNPLCLSVPPTCLRACANPLKTCAHGTSNAEHYPPSVAGSTYHRKRPYCNNSKLEQCYMPKDYLSVPRHLSLSSHVLSPVLYYPHTNNIPKPPSDSYMPPYSKDTAHSATLVLHIAATYLPNRLCSYSLLLARIGT